ncbi:MAG: CDP-alcohol phosphatidyltransferase family protein [bacterium JZ-2024 1]
MRLPAIWLCRKIQDLPVSPHHLTAGFVIAGFLAGVFLLKQKPVFYLFAAVFLQIKNLLDAMDGTLARIRQTPSRVGRFLDSLSDFFLNIWIFFCASPNCPFLVFFAFFSATFQCSYYNYLVVSYRHKVSGDITSLPEEREEWWFPGDSPHIGRILQKMYLLVYGWQDFLIARLDKILAPDKESSISPVLLTFFSPLALGFHLLLLTLASLLLKPSLALWFIAVPLNIYFIFLLFFRRGGKRFYAPADQKI